MSLTPGTAHRWPRDWFREIAQLPTLAQRRAALEAMPQEYRPMVETYLRIAWEQKRSAVESKQ
jgi:hypothetical protein